MCRRDAKVAVRNLSGRPIGLWWGNTALASEAVPNSSAVVFRLAAGGTLAIGFTPFDSCLSPTPGALLASVAIGRGDRGLVVTESGLEDSTWLDGSELADEREKTDDAIGVGSGLEPTGEPAVDAALMRFARADVDGTDRDCRELPVANAPFKEAGVEVLVLEGVTNSTECDAIFGPDTLRRMARSVLRDEATNRAASSPVRDSWELLVEPSGPLLPPYRRILALVRERFDHVDVRAQEPVSLIRYEAGGHYWPHCDALCGEPLPWLAPARVATAILYCHLPDDHSGATLFPNLRRRYKPREGDALFFTYFDPTTSQVDPRGLSRHAGCPVSQGRHKHVATFFFRAHTHPIHAHPAHFFPDGSRRPIL